LTQQTALIDNTLLIGPGPHQSGRQVVAGKLSFMWRWRVDVGEWSFLGVTLWSEIPPALEKEAGVMMTDFRKINFQGQSLTPAEYTQLHRDDVAWLAAQVAAIHAANATAAPRAPQRVVILSHHPPTLQEIMHEEDAHSGGVTLGLGTELTGDPRLFCEPVVLWAHGHTHYSHDRLVPAADGRGGPIRLVSNQRGYPREAGMTGFRPELGVDLHAPSLALWHAVYAGDLEQVNALLVSSVPILVDYRWARGHTPLIALAAGGTRYAPCYPQAVQMLPRLLAAGADVRAVDDEHHPPLWHVLMASRQPKASQKFLNALRDCLIAAGGQEDPQWALDLPPSSSKHCSLS
jgi:hypothetical protein